MPQTQNTTSPPQSLAQRPPAAIPAAELRPLPVGSPLSTPSGQIEPTIRIANCRRAKPPAHCPKTGPPVANCRRAHRRPGPPRGRPVHSPPSTERRSLPPPVLSGTWGPRRRRHLHAPAPSLALGRNWAGAFAPTRARAWLGQNPSPRPTRAETLFLFSFFSIFLL